MASQMSKKGFLADEHSCVTGVKSLALGNTKHTTIQNIIRAPSWQMGLLKESQPIADTILDEVSSFCGTVSKSLHDNHDFERLLWTYQLC